MAAYKPRPRPKAGVFKLTPAEKAILEKKPTGPKYTPKPKPKAAPTPGFFKPTAKEKAILTKTPTSNKKYTPRPRPSR